MINDSRKSVVITGPDGLLGSTLVKELSGPFNVIPARLDVTSQSKIRVFSDKLKSADWVIHTAAIVDIDYCEVFKKKAYRVNVEGTRNALQLAKLFEANFLYISTPSIFTGRGDFKEGDLPQPQNYYDLTKYLGEVHTLNYEKGYVIRANIVGVHPFKKRQRNLVEWLLGAISQNQDIKLFTDVIFNPLSNWTLALYIKKMLLKDKIGMKIMHFGSRNHISKGAFCKMIIAHFKNFTGGTENVSLDNLTFKGKRVKNAWLSTKKTEKILKIKMPSVKREVGVILSKINSPGLKPGVLSFSLDSARIPSLKPGYSRSK